MSELAQKSGSKHRKEILRERNADDHEEDMEQAPLEDSTPRCLPSPDDMIDKHLLFWLHTPAGAWVMAWDYGLKQWFVHGERESISPEQAARNGWTYMKKADIV